MADKGFLIEKELEKIGLKFNIPPFAQSNRQMAATDITTTKKMAAHRVHVEKGNRQNKEIQNCIWQNSQCQVNKRQPNLVCWKHAVQFTAQHTVESSVMKNVCLYLFC